MKNSKAPAASAANAFLRQKMDEYDEASPPSAATVAIWRGEFNRRLDADMAVATTHEQTLKLRALGIAGIHAFDGMLGVGSQITLETFDGMVALATGERKQTGLDPVKPRRSQHSAREEWELARAIVAVQLGYDRFPAFPKWLRTATGMDLRQIKKMIDNMDQGQGRYETVKINIDQIRDRLEKGECWIFEDLKA